MEFHGKKETLKNIIVDAVPGGAFDTFKEGLRYRAKYGATITWWSSTGKLLIQEPEKFKGLTRDRLYNFLYPDKPQIYTAGRAIRERRVKPEPHPGVRSKFKAPNSALARQR